VGSAQGGAPSFAFFANGGSLTNGQDEYQVSSRRHNGGRQTETRRPAQTRISPNKNGVCLNVSDRRAYLTQSFHLPLTVLR
jgi:hypothetical protein